MYVVFKHTIKFLTNFLCIYTISILKFANILIISYHLLIVFIVINSLLILIIFIVLVPTAQ
jgi:hypothetical protein